MPKIEINDSTLLVAIPGTPEDYKVMLINPDNLSVSRLPLDLLVPEAPPVLGVSAATKSKYMLGLTGGGLVENDFVKVKNVNNKNLVSMYKMPAGNLTSELDNMTFNDAMAAATITLDDGFDNVVVAGTNQNSYAQFPFIFSLHRGVYRMKLRVDAIGTAPLVGFRNIWPGSTYSNFNNPHFFGYVNLATGAITCSTNGTTTTTNLNGFIGTVAANDIIELEIQFEYMRPRIFRVIKNGAMTGEISVINQLKNTNSDGEWDNCSQPAIILADGEYTIIEYEILSMENRPLIMLEGDSMSTGVRVTYANSIIGNLDTKLPYRVASSAAGSKYLAGHLATLWIVSKLRPTYLLFSHYLESCQGLANPANGGHAAWSAAFQKYVSIIKALGIIPVFVYPETWAVLDPTGVNSAFYETYLNTNYPADPKIKVPTSQSVYDGTGFHYAGATNAYIADQLIAYLESVSAL